MPTTALEQCQWSPRTGKFYIIDPGQLTVAGNDTEEAAVAVIDPKTKMVEKTFLIPRRTTARRRKEWQSGRTVRSCLAAPHRLPMGTRTPSSSTSIAGRS